MPQFVACATAGGKMTKHLKAAFLCFSLAMPLLSGFTRATEQKKPTQPAPIPAQILAAKKVFIANGGGDESHYEAASYTGGPDRAYNEFYAAMKTWGRYELVAAPGDADLIFEIRLTVFQLQRERVLADDDPATDTQFRMVIRDTKTHETLWGLTEHAHGAVLQSNRDKNFEQAMAAIVAEVQRIAGPAAPAKN
jgi:hypothetical protein